MSYKFGNSSGNISFNSLSDLNSLVVGDVSQDEWDTILSLPPFMRTNAGLGLEGYNNASFANWTNTASTFALDTPFSPPTGVTQVSFEVDASLFAGGAVSSTIEISICDSTGITPIVTATACVLTSSMVRYTTGAITVTPGTFYRARILFGNGLASSPAQALIGSVRVKPITATDPFYTSSFVRYNASQSLMWDNGREGLSNQGTLSGVLYRRQTPFSRFRFMTNALTIGIQLFNLISGIAPQVDQVVVNVNGQPWTTVTGTALTHSVKFVTLPVPTVVGSSNLIEIVISTGAYVVNSDIQCDYLQSVLVPSSASFQVIEPTQTNERILICGDSKDSGYFSTVPGLMGWPMLLRKELPATSIAVEAYGSRSLFGDCLTEANMQVTVAKLAQYKPTKFLMMTGRNDWATASIPPILFGARLGQFIDAFHQALPYCSIYIISTWTESSEVANGLGFTLPNYRSAMQDVATARSSWITFLDGTAVTGYSPTFTFDGIHPDDRGNSLIAAWLLPLIQPVVTTGVISGVALAEKQIFYGKSIAAAGNYSVPIVAPSSGEVMLVTVDIVGKDTSNNTCAKRIMWRTKNISGTITIGTGDVIYDDSESGAVLDPVMTSATIDTSLSLVLTTTNNGANTINITYYITVERMS